MTAFSDQEDRLAAIVPAYNEAATVVEMLSRQTRRRQALVLLLPAAITLLVPAGGCIPEPESAARSVEQGVSEHFSATPNMHVHDFGRVRPHDVIRHSFVIANDSSEAWTIEKIVPECLCTVVEPDSTEISPGAQGELETSLRVPEGYGDIQKRIRVFFRESGHEPITLQLVAAVRPPLVAHPPRLDIRGDLPSRPASVRVLHFADAPSESVHVATNSPHLHCELFDETDARDSQPDDAVQSWRISIAADSPDPGDPASVISGVVTLTVSPGDDMIEIPVVVSCADSVRVTPELAHFGSVAGGEQPSRSIQFMLEPPLTVADLTVTARLLNSGVRSGTALNARIVGDATEHDGHLHVELCIDGDEVPGTILRGTVEIRTTRLTREGLRRSHVVKLLPVICRVKP